MGELIVDTSNIWELRRQAESQFRKESYSRALQLFTIILEFDPTDAEARYKRALCQYSLGNDASAIHDLSTVLDIHPNHVPARVKRAELAYNMQMVDLDVLVEQLPAYCQQFYGSHPNINDLPKDIRVFTHKIIEIFVERARIAEREERLDDAVKYWQAYHDCGVEIDYDLSRNDAQKIIQQLTWKIAARRGDL